MLELLEKLCRLEATSGDEASVRKFITEQLDGFCEYRTDKLGNIIAFKKGKKTSSEKLLIDAHMDEVGLIITGFTDAGFLRFKKIGAIDTAAILGKTVIINGEILGAVCSKPIHLIGKDEAEKLPSEDSLYIDIGAASCERAQALVSVGDRAVLQCDFVSTNELIMAKALDDRIGCAVLIKLLREESEYDFYASFSVQEEVGLRGAKTAAFSVSPDSAIVLEATTAADIADVPQEKTVCKLGDGAAVSFMDNATVYDRDYYNAAMNSGIKCQPKSAVAGGNNAGAIHLSGEGVRVVALSVPCRYIHTAQSVANKEDIACVYQLAKYFIASICGGSL